MSGPYSPPLNIKPNSPTNPIPILPAQQKLRSVKSSLWLAILIAFAVGSVNIVVGTLGVMTYYQRGPLYNKNIDSDQLSGKIINTSNIASLISAIATLLSASCSTVYSGLARSWLLRKAKRGEAATLRQWRAVASGGKFNSLRSSPFVAGGLIVLTLSAAGIMSAVFTGVLVPNVKDIQVGGNIISVPGYSGNAGYGRMVSCLNTTTVTGCAPAAGYGSIAQALSQAGTSFGSTTYDFLGSTVLQLGAPYSAGLIGYLDRYGNMSIRLDYKSIKYTSVGMQVSATCVNNPIVGANSTGSYYYQSFCSGLNETFGSWQNTVGTYSTASGCVYDGSSYLFEYAMGGAVLREAGQSNNSNPFSFSCYIKANEGTIVSDVQDTITTFKTFSQTNVLTGEEIRRFASALVAVVIQEGAIEGKAGIIALGARNVRPRGSTSLNLQLANQIVANGASAAATIGYMSIIPYVNSFTLSYPSLYDGSYSYIYPGFGWIASENILAWGSIALILGVAWMSSIFYMAAGGTRYDPTDWHQTLNTAAGSSIYQHPGTSTGAGLGGSNVSKSSLYYGDVGNNQVGFSHSPVGSVQPGRVYV